MPAIRTARTIRHLKAGQIVGQVRNRLRPLWERPARFANGTVPPFPGCHWPADAGFLPPGTQGNTSATLRAGRFAFVNHEETLGWPPDDWQAPDAPKLWQYNLHYFEWLWALDFDDARAAILDWIARHPLDTNQVGWEPYPTSLRLMNWCALCFGRFREQTLADDDFLHALWASIVRQATWLSGHIETHLLGNHLLENGAALAFAGSCFKGDAAEGWRNAGSGILEREIPEQILPDGMHFERSPMYHVRMTYLLQLLRDTGNDRLQALVDAPLERMCGALAHLCHPDGEIALFNDSAFSIYNTPRELLGDGSAEDGPWALPDAGYYGYRDGGTYLICDAGPIGPDYIPGHAHGDMFSFELSLQGQRVIVDSGVCDYVPGSMREYCRSTRAHNTLEVAGHDQSEFWGAFRVARRAYPRDVQWSPAEEGFRLDAWHTGYQRLPGRPTHHRQFRWAGGALHVRDRVHSRRHVTAVSRIHLHPQCRLTWAAPDEALVDYDGGSFRIVFTGAGVASEEESKYCPEFGRCESNIALAYTLQGTESEAAFSVVPN